MAPRSGNTLALVTDVADNILSSEKEFCGLLDSQADSIRVWLTTAFQNNQNQSIKRNSEEQPAPKKRKMQSETKLAPEVLEEILAMKVKDLQQELRERDLDTKGLKKDLRARLIRAMEDEIDAENNEDVEMEEAPVETAAKPELQSPIPQVQETEPEPMVIEPEEVDPPVPPVVVEQQKIANKSKSPKRSRSPFKAMHSKVQSAIKIFSAKKKSPYRQVSNQDDDKSVEEILKEIKVEAKELDFDKHVENESKLSSTQKPTIQIPRLINKFNTQNSASSSKSTGSAMSESMKAKNEERKAKLQARMRENSSKNKPLATKSALTFDATQSAATKLKKDNSVRKNLTEQIREKALNSNLGAPKAGAAVLKSLSPALTAAFPKTNPTYGGIPKSPPPSAKISPKRAPILSPMSTYEITDHEGDSDSDSDDEKQVAKKIPSWAERAQLRVALENQCKKGGPGFKDPDEIFGEVQTCNLDLIFAASKNSRFRNRTSSGNWEKDKVTTVEKIKYKRQMGYIA